METQFSFKEIKIYSNPLYLNDLTGLNICMLGVNEQILNWEF